MSSLETVILYPVSYWSWSLIYSWTHSHLQEQFWDSGNNLIAKTLFVLLYILLKIASGQVIYYLQQPSWGVELTMLLKGKVAITPAETAGTSCYWLRKSPGCSTWAADCIPTSYQGHRTRKQGAGWKHAFSNEWEGLQGRHLVKLISKRLSPLPR